MKFDVIIGNPPYDGSLHLEFISKSAQLADRVIMIHPAGWLFRNSSQTERDVKEQIDTDTVGITILQGNAHFDRASFACPLVITHLDKTAERSGFTLHYQTTNNSYELNSLAEMPSGFWEPKTDTLALVDKFKELSQHRNLYELVSTTVNEFCVTAPRIVGHGATNDARLMCCPDFWNFFYTNSDLKNFSTINKVFRTNTNEERTNLISYLRTKFARFGLLANKVTQDLYISRYLQAVPLPPLDRTWTDDTINKYYDITTEEAALIDLTVPTYEFNCD